jgi:tripartite-type tricarboxylate transporter receptor subunit TctC
MAERKEHERNREERMRPIRTAVAACAVAFGLVAAASVASADWPNDKTMTIVSPWLPGTGTDLIARLLADGISKKYGSQVIVENKPGATGNIGQAYVAKAAPDGYTFIVTTPGPAANNILTFKSLSFNPLTDFTWVSLVSELPLVIVAGPKTEGRDVKEFFAYAKANPTKVTFGNPGHGTYAHMAQLSLQEMSGAKFNIVPYKGAPQMIPDMLSGQIDGCMDLLAGYLPQIRAGKIRAIGVAGNSRNEFIPDVPTLKEAGLSLTTSPWYGLQGPKGIPRDIVDKMNAVTKEILSTPAAKEKYAAVGMTVRTTTPEEFEQLVKAEVEQWRPIVAKYDLKSD